MSMHRANSRRGRSKRGRLGRASLGTEDRGHAGSRMWNWGNRVSIGGASLYCPLDLITTAMAMVKTLTDKRGAACLTKQAAQSATLGSPNNAQCGRPV